MRARSAQPAPDPTPNTYPINTTAPVLVRTVANGQAYRAGPPGGEFWVLHLYGTPYDWGYAHGSLMKDEVLSMLNRTWTYLEAQVAEQLSGLPNWL